MSRGRRLTFKILGIIFFLLAIATVLASLISASGAGRSPGLFLAVVLAGLGKWLWGKGEGKSARQTFGRAIEVVNTDDSTDVRGGSR